MDFQLQLEEKVKEIEEVLRKFLPVSKGNQSLIYEAMEYSLLAGGKRIRPLIIKESYSMFGGSGEEVEAFMVAMEMIHTYSLVHDDLPAMDDDDYRRGRLTTHKVYGEDMGILAGDSLLNFAYEVIHSTIESVIDIHRDGVSKNQQGMDVSCDTVDFSRTFDKISAMNRALQVLSKKAGVYGMIGGQVIDVKSSGKTIDQSLLEDIFQLKTAALMEASFMIGAILAGASNEEIASMEQVGRGLGMAFQIQDDVLDICSSSQVLGKPTHSDEKNEKTTYVSLLGLEESKVAVERHSREAITLLRNMPGDSEFLEELIEMLIYREK